jgi:hypothetical protein
MFICDPIFTLGLRIRWWGLPGGIAALLILMRLGWKKILKIFVTVESALSTGPVEAEYHSAAG